MIEIGVVERIHEILIARFGGSLGIRDRNALEAAINRPFTTFDQKELYPLATDKAAALLESIIKNHPFIDGNKRMGYVLARLLLMQAGKDISATEDQKYNFILSISKGELSFEQIKEWLHSNHI